MQAGPTHEALKPLCWLIGKWKSVYAKGHYPTIKTFTFCEEMEFISLGQPLLNYTSMVWDPEKKGPIHLERGFLRIKPCSTQVAFLLGHNLGYSTVEEGAVEGSRLGLKTSSIASMCFVKQPSVVELRRSYSYCSCVKELEMVLCMATCNTPLTEHLRVVYKKNC